MNERRIVFLDPRLIEYESSNERTYILAWEPSSVGRWPKELTGDEIQSTLDRANALPDTEARLAEAVELLEMFRDYECTCADLGRGFKCDICQVRAFLDKVRA